MAQASWLSGARHSAMKHSLAGIGDVGSVRTSAEHIGLRKALS